MSRGSMDAVKYAYVEFEYPDEDKLVRVCRFADAIATAKRDHPYTVDPRQFAQLLDAEQLNWFIWPAGMSHEQALTRWADASPSAPVIQTPSSTSKGWRFPDFIQVLFDCDFDLLGCKPVRPGVAHMAFVPNGYPYGGTSCIWALIAAFGCRVVAEDDWTGPRREIAS